MDLQQQNSTVKPEQIIEIVLKRKWIILIPLCISLTVGLLYTFTADKKYIASTTILIQPQKVPTQYIQSVVSSDLNQRLNTISQQILSRSNIEKIIDQFGLYQNSKGMYLEDKVKSMRQRIRVKIEEGRRTGTEAFSVAFTGRDPERVMRVANTLASYFMDENLKVRETQAIGTSEFLQSELVKIKAKLEEREQLLSQFRAKHLGGLPDELESNLRTLDRLQIQLSDRQSALRDLNNSITLIQSQIARTKEIQEQQENILGSTHVQENGRVQFVGTDSERQLEMESQLLDELLLKYTQKHPEVIKQKKKVEKLKEKLAEETNEKQESIASTINSERNENNQTDLKPITQEDQLIFKQEMHIKQLRNEVQKTQADIVKIKHSMRIYQQRVEDTPKREQELQSLQRDYSNIRDIYNSLLDRQLESELAVNMEKKQKGEQFRILDHARLPEKPFSPDIEKLFLLSIAIGLAFGGGIIFLLEFLDTTIKRPEQIETEFGMPLLASIPTLNKPGKNIKKKIDWILFILFTFYAAAVFSAFTVVNYKGLDKTIKFIKMQLNL